MDEAGIVLCISRGGITSATTQSAEDFNASFILVPLLSLPSNESELITSLTNIIWTARSPIVILGIQKGIGISQASLWREQTFGVIVFLSSFFFYVPSELLLLANRTIFANV